ncbi:MAG: SDR family NAD(P)-dependent oxidoreductase [Gemmatimonadetes bacterium]|nr:SDR family NAD(P)-dependent oxidoreductase [Gemmatimonadota bacterium]MYB54945.1 SDR family NAD(P)-dependent oxidoreductase [Gemmatimonadota bacterium]
MQKKTVLITGATDGIGRALAKIYRTRGDRLVLVGRRPLDTLNDALYTKDTYCRADLSQDGCADRICEFLNAQKIDTIDLVIQNAGTGYFGPIAEQSAESIRDITAVNLMAPLRLTHALIPYLQANGKLVLIGSIAHAFPCPDYAVYAASKEAINTLGRNLQIEGDVNVQIIHPGATRTGLHRKIGMDNEKTKGFPSAERVAQKITRAIDGRRFIATIGWRNAWARFLGRYCEGIVNAIVRTT